jgi:peptide chain release factor 3
MDELEREFGILTCPFNWPIGSGPSFAGVWDRQGHQAHLYERTERGAYRAPVELRGIEDPRLESLIGPSALAHLREELELLDVVGEPFDRDRFLSGQLSPTFFGSAVNNFGIDIFLRWFIEHAPPPGARLTSAGTQPPESEELTGFIFKIQANMDRQHRDRVAFLRICSGRYEKDMTVTNVRTGKSVRLSRSQRLFGQERETIDVAYAGDIIGLMNPGVFAIGDSVTTGRRVHFQAIPRFSPERFATVRCPDPSKRKALLKGLDQLREEGAIQVLRERGMGSPDPILAAVGQLQFDVVKFRLESEYSVEAILSPLSFVAARWIDASSTEVDAMVLYSGTRIVEDIDGLPVVLFQSEWHIGALQEKNPGVRLNPVAQGETVLA